VFQGFMPLEIVCRRCCRNGRLAVLGVAAQVRQRKRCCRESLRADRFQPLMSCDWP